MMAHRISSIIAAGIFFAVIASAQPATARPEYNKEFWNLYKKELAGQTAKCAVCHDGANKKVRNNYGEALEKKLGVRNVKDSARIINALRETEKEPSAVPGLTFGDLINMGKLPASKK
jgi:hypothetical protein